jgi:hypothetical protein
MEIKSGAGVHLWVGLPLKFFGLGMGFGEFWIFEFVIYLGFGIWDFHQVIIR